METTLASAMSDILDVCERCTGVFQLAAARARHPELRALFARRAGEYERANGELQVLLSKLGGISLNIPHDSLPSVELPARAGDAFNAASSGGAGDLAMLEECERLELIALDSYGRALLVAPPHHLRFFLEFQRATAAANLHYVRAIVHAAMERQCEDVRRNHAHVHGLREHVRTRARHP